MHTSRGGAAAKAGHDLLIHVTAWQATLDVGEEPGRRASSSPPTPPRCACSEGTGGMQALGEDDKANIHQTIDDEVLKRRDIVFRSTARAGRRRPDRAWRAT